MNRHARRVAKSTKQQRKVEKELRVLRAINRDLSKMPYDVLRKAMGVIKHAEPADAVEDAERLYDEEEK